MVNVPLPSTLRFSKLKFVFCQILNKRIAFITLPYLLTLELPHPFHSPVANMLSATEYF